MTVHEADRADRSRLERPTTGSPGDWGPYDHRIAIRSTNPLVVDDETRAGTGGIAHYARERGHDAVIIPRNERIEEQGQWVLVVDNDAMRVVVPDYLVDRHPNQLPLPFVRDAPDQV